MRAAALALASGIALGVASGVAAPAGAQADADTTPPPYPPPGRLVDVGGWRLHLHCVGEGDASRPTVILEPGVGDFSVEWSLVQPGVARFARVCTYDRAGDGWSEIGPHPRTFRQVVYELHTLLARAGERGPFVLVGSSYGGWLVRAYQRAYPGEVAGLVLVESGIDDPWRFANGKLVRSSALAKGTPVPAPQTAHPLRLTDIPPAAMAQIRAGIAATVSTANAPPRTKLPEAARRMRAWAAGRVGHIVAGVNPFEHEELAELRAARRAGGEFPLGDLPLVVLTRGLPDEDGPGAAEREAEHRREHAGLARMSRAGRLVVAARSGHHVLIDEPELVVDAIREVVGRR